MNTLFLALGFVLCLVVGTACVSHLLRYLRSVWTWLGFLVVVAGMILCTVVGGRLGSWHWGLALSVVPADILLWTMCRISVGDFDAVDEGVGASPVAMYVTQQIINKKESWYGKCPRCGTAHSIDPSMEGIVALTCRRCRTSLTVTKEGW